MNSPRDNTKEEASDMHPFECRLSIDLPKKDFEKIKYRFKISEQCTISYWEDLDKGIATTFELLVTALKSNKGNCNLTILLYRLDPKEDESKRKLEHMLVSSTALNMCRNIVKVHKECQEYQRVYAQYQVPAWVSIDEAMEY